MKVFYGLEKGRKARGDAFSSPESVVLGHVVLKRGALEAAFTECQKISDIRSRMCRKYHCSCS